MLFLPIIAAVAQGAAAVASTISTIVAGATRAGLNSAAIGAAAKLVD